MGVRVEIMMMMMIIVQLGLICYSPFIMCGHCIENKNFSKILAVLCIHFSDVAKIINTHTHTRIHDYWFVSGFQERKIRRRRREELRCVDDAMACCCYSGERASGRGGCNNEEKSLADC